MSVECLACGHQRSFSAGELDRWARATKKLYLGSSTLGILTGRMRCSMCGSKRIDWWPRNRD